MVKQNQLLKIASYKYKFKFPIDCIRINNCSYNFCNNNDWCVFKNGFVFLTKFFKNNSEIEKFLVLFKKRVKISYKKLELVAPILKALSKISLIKGVLITGSVASLNAKPNDDIDIFLITKPKRIWTIRAIETLLLGFLGTRRHKNTMDNSNKLCMNLYKTEDFLGFNKHNIAYATQLVEAIPIYFSDSNVFKNLILENSWVKKYYNAWYKTQKHVKLPYNNWFNYSDSGQKSTMFTAKVTTQSNSNLQPVTNISIFKKWGFYSVWLLVLILSKILETPLGNIVEFILGNMQFYKARKEFLSYNQVLGTKQITTWYNRLEILVK